MAGIAIAVVIGVLSAGGLPTLIPLGWFWGLVPLVLALPWAGRWRRGLAVLLALLCGLAWGSVYGHRQLAHQLPADWVGRDLRVSGYVVDLPQRDSRRERFTLAVSHWQGPPEGAAPAAVGALLPRRLLISWYGTEEPVVVGDHWQLTLRLRPARGFVNPGGFDYQAWLLRQRIDALGYVRTDPGNRRLPPDVTSRLHPSHAVGRLRDDLRTWLHTHAQHPDTGILQALLIGDRGQISPARWGLLQGTGTNHLIAISGLHVGFVALLGFVLGAGLGRLFNLYWHRCPAALPGYLGAIACAAFYSALAGFSLPTQRALIMVLLVQLAFVLRRSYRVQDVWLLALVAVVLMDPLAGFDLGFWLSFGAVAVLLFGFAGRLSGTRPLPGAALVRAQWLVFVGLLLPLALLVHTSALVAPVANILAIPLVTFLLVPPLLLAALVHTWLPTLAEWLLVLAQWGLSLLIHWLEWLQRLGQGQLNPVLSFSPWALLLAAVGVVLLLLPRGLPGRWLGAPAVILAVLLPGPPAPALQVTHLEVGQGLAVVVRAGARTLVFDTGPSFGERFDAGSGIVAPYLRRAGIRRIDTLVVSHRHSDHAGGLEGLLAAFPVERVLLGEPDQHALTGADSCHNSEAWQWGEVVFEFLRWPIAVNASANNRSCVLLIHYGDTRVLLTGDIERAAERQLLRAGVLPSAISLLQAPHHGSRSSSTPDFVTRVQPEWVIYSAGYGSRHGHPHPEVVERYWQQGSRALSTALDGALEVTWHRPGEPEIRAWRHHRARYWFARTEAVDSFLAPK